MPYYKNSIRARANRLNRFSGKGPDYIPSTGKGALAVAKGAYKMAKAVKSQLNVEYKDLTNQVNYAPTTAAGTVTLMNGIVQGTSSSQRVGRQIEIKSVNVHARIKIDAVTPKACTVRFILFKWKGPDGRTPVVADILENTATGNHQAFYNLDNVPQDFQILQDKKFELTPGDRDMHSFNIRYNRDIKTRYQGAGGNFADMSTNGLYMLVVSSTIDGLNFPSVDMAYRVRYVDN